MHIPWDTQCIHTHIYVCTRIQYSSVRVPERCSLRNPSPCARPHTDATMSTQQAPSIDFSIARNLTNFQLVELPDELVQLIAGHAGPSPVLQLKSEAESGHAVLCSSNKTFPVRSVQTSNSLFVVRPAVTRGHDPDAVPSHGIRAISSCGITLELSQSTESALPYLRKRLPEYSSRNSDVAAAAKASYEDVCSDIPLSSGEIHDAWLSICAFEEQGAIFRPTADVLLQLWRSIVTAAVAASIDMGSAFPTEDLWRSVEDEDFPRGMFDALLRRMEDPSVMSDEDNGSRSTATKRHARECAHEALTVSSRLFH
ncbi:hypothetical protein, variant [Verruconis gallopava]|uniref:Sister chromatid cohesion protein Dcc1 n=1 Tax=Verruconis gallopava TaxID=253628 RepID=A0A0D2ARQ7_9PEZI|nr:hypothetical protein, variant [Verruconis gallopava]KIW01874.1 hypothetical protein, variant [Verruconis gallopava]